MRRQSANGRTPVDRGQPNHDHRAMTDAADPRSPMEIVAPLAVDEGLLADGSRHVELYTMEGLLTFHWSGDPAAERVVVAMGGAMGGVLGPAKRLYHQLAMEATDRGIGVLRVGYRKPGRLDTCLVDVAAAAETAAKVGAERFVFLGHSFGGAVAIQAAVTMPAHTAGVGVFATQSAGCECAGELPDAPFVLYHGDQDRILPADSSLMVQMIAGRGDVRILAGADHLLSEAADEIREHFFPWLDACFAGAG